MEYGTLNPKVHNYQIRLYDNEFCQDLVDKQRNRVDPYQISISTFFVEIHLDVVLKVLLVVGLDFFYKTSTKYHKNIN